MFLLAAEMPMPSMKVALCCALGPIGIGAKPTLPTIFDLLGSTSGAEKPMPSHHIAARPWLKVVWHSLQL